MNRWLRSYGICLRGWPSNCCCEIGVCKLAISDRQLCVYSSQHVEWRQHLKISHCCQFLSNHHLPSYLHTDAFSSIPSCALIGPIPPPCAPNKLKCYPRHLLPEDEGKRLLPNVCTFAPDFTEGSKHKHNAFNSFPYFLSYSELSYPIIVGVEGYCGVWSHTLSVWLLWTSDQPDTETSVPDNTQHSQETWIHPPPQSRFEPAITESGWPKTHALDSGAAGFGQFLPKCSFDLLLKLRHIWNFLRILQMH